MPLQNDPRYPPLEMDRVRLRDDRYPLLPRNHPDPVIETLGQVCHLLEHTSTLLKEAVTILTDLKNKY